MIHVLLMIDDASMGGGQQHLFTIARHLDRRRFTVSVACEEKGYLVDELRRNSIPVYPLVMSNQVSLSSLYACVKLLRSIRPDVVHTHGGTAGFVGRLGAWMAGIKAIIHTYHGIHYLHEAQTIRKRLYRWIDWLLIGCTDQLVCVAKKDYDLGIRAGIVSPLKSVVIQNGIDVQKYSSVVSNQNHAKRQRIVGTIGRLHLQKGHCYLLEAAVRVLNRTPNLLFQIIGEGELRASLEKQAQEIGIAEHVQFLGNQLDVPELLAEMDIFVLPSLWEGLPLVLLEAMATKRPIVVTKVDGVDEVITDGQNGLLVPPKDPIALADAIIRLLEDRPLAEAMGHRAYETVLSKFNMERMIRQLEHLYETTLVGMASDKGKD